jgi:hypothetical protein
VSERSCTKPEKKSDSLCQTVASTFPERTKRPGENADECRRTFSDSENNEFRRKRLLQVDVRYTS